MREGWTPIPSCSLTEVQSGRPTVDVTSKREYRHPKSISSRFNTRSFRGIGVWRYPGTIGRRRVEVGGQRRCRAVGGLGAVPDGGLKFSARLCHPWRGRSVSRIGERVKIEVLRDGKKKSKHTITLREMLP